MYLYFPGKQWIQGPPSGPVVPITQTQSLMLLLPSIEFESCRHDMHILLLVAPGIVEYFPASHFTHSMSPLVSLYFQGMHVTQDPPSGPVVSILHVQYVM